MGVFIPIAVLVAAYITTAVIVIEAITALTLVAIIAAAVAVAATGISTYYYIEGDIQNSMLFAGIAIAAGVGGIYVSYLSETAEVNALLAEGTGEAIAAAETAETSFAYSVVGYVDAAYSSWQSLAETLHLKLAAQIHQIAYLVSQDYRNMMAKIFNQVSDVSVAMGWGALTLNLLFENTRTMILDVSTSLGEGYDLSQIKWLNTYSAYLKEINQNASYYRANPSAFIDWISDNTYRPGLDAKAGTVRSIFSGIDSALGLIKVTAEDLTRFKNDTLKLVGDLPSVIRDQILPSVKKVTDDFDRFVKLTYDPAIKILDGSLKALGFDMEDQKKKASELISRLARPGKYLSEVDNEDVSFRQDDENIIGGIAERSEVRQMEHVSTTGDKYYEDLEAKIQEYEKEKPVSLTKAPEFLTLEPEKKEPVEKVTSPFVGDF
jgi:hypothetical protein